MLHLKDFHYHLPSELIAQEPVFPRDNARLMLINRKTKEITHHHVYDLPDLLSKNTTFVVNNTKVFPSRLHGKKITGGKVEILVTSPLGNSVYHCLTRPGLKKDDQVIFEAGLSGIITEANPQNDIERTIKFSQEESVLRTTLSKIGEMPTPPYIKKLLQNNADYQTIYAKYGFSSAAPTAGLHFTHELMNKIKSQYNWQEVTLDVGLGTFLPVKVDNIESHHMHKEKFTITEEVADSLNKDKSNGKTILAVGTTSMRTLESSVEDGILKGSSKETGIYIYPPYKFKYVDALMTNFHLPESTLLMLVSAFTSSPNTDSTFTSFKDSLLGIAYQEAIKENYRFFSFGDAMLII